MSCRIPGVLTAATLLTVLAAPAAQGAAVYGGIGTTGFLVGIEHQYSDSFGVRADLDAAALSRTTSDSDASYQGNLHLAVLGLFADYHPWAGNFRLSAGALIGDSYLSGDAVATTSGTFTLNGVPVSAAGQSLSAKVRFPTVRPFLGLGWGHAPKSTGVFGQFDMGVAFGRPEVTLSATPQLAAAALAAGTSVEGERFRLQDKVNSLRLYPVLRAGIGWGW